MKNEEIVRNADISENFTIVGNNIIKDNRLSIEARFVLIFMRSFKKGWVFYKKDIQGRLDIGRRVIDRCFEELVNVGYLVETDLITNGTLFPTKGFTVYPYSIKDEPIALYSSDVQNVQGKNTKTSITQETALVQNVHGNSSSLVQNVHLINTKEYNTKEKNKKESEIDYKGLNEAVEKWLLYKKERKQAYKGTATIQTMIDRLYAKSQGSPERAKEIVDYSMANNYQGLFEPLSVTNVKFGPPPAARPAVNTSALANQDNHSNYADYVAWCVKNNISPEPERP